MTMNKLVATCRKNTNFKTRLHTIRHRKRVNL